MARVQAEKTSVKDRTRHAESGNRLMYVKPVEIISALQFIEEATAPNAIVPKCDSAIVVTVKGITPLGDALNDLPLGCITFLLSSQNVNLISASYQSDVLFE